MEIFLTEPILVRLPTPPLRGCLSWLPKTPDLVQRAPCERARLGEPSLNQVTHLAGVELARMALQRGRRWSRNFVMRTDVAKPRMNRG
jgi:hypothetical protein